MIKNKNFLLKKYYSWSFFFRVIMIISLVLAFWKKDYAWMVGTFIGVFISFLPSLLKKNIEITLPWVFDFLIAVVVVLHMGGRLLEFYYTLPGYHIMTTFFISILVAFISFTLIYILHVYWEGLIMDKYAMGFVTVITTMSIGVILEFIKFLNIAGIYYEKTNHALMLNLTADTLAGLIIAIIGVNLIKKGEFDEITSKFGKQLDSAIIHRERKK